MSGHWIADAKTMKHQFWVFRWKWCFSKLGNPFHEIYGKSREIQLKWTFVIFTPISFEFFWRKKWLNDMNEMVKKEAKKKEKTFKRLWKSCKKIWCRDVGNESFDGWYYINNWYLFLFKFYLLSYFIISLIIT